MSVWDTNLSPPELITAYEHGPAVLAAAVAGMSAEQLRARPIAGKWTSMEVVAHLADWEPIGADRMKRTLALDRPLLLGADEKALVSALAYQDRDLEEELGIIRRLTNNPPFVSVASFTGSTQLSRSRAISSSTKCSVILPPSASVAIRVIDADNSRKLPDHVASDDVANLK